MPLTLYALSLFLLSAAPHWVFAAECKTEILFRGRSLKLGQKVEVRTSGGLSRRVFFIGSAPECLYFSEPGSLEPICLDSNALVLPDAGSGMATIPQRVAQSEGNDASVGILGCLRVLEDLRGLPPGRLAALVHNFPFQLFESINRDLGENTPGQTVLRVEKFLSAARISFRTTKSVRELFAHLEKGFPAYLGLGVTVAEKRAFPAEHQKPSRFLGVFAFGSLPAGRWFTGGKKMVLVDSLSGKVALWPAAALTNTPDLEIVLVYPYQAND